MKKQKVFIPVIYNDLKYDNTYDVIFPSQKRKNPEVSLVKEQEGYFFTPEELRNLIRDVYGKGSMADQDCSEDEYFKNKKDYIESLNIK